MRYTITYVTCKDARNTYTPHPGTMDADEAARFVRRATMQDARDNIARLSDDVPSLMVPYMDNPSAAVEVRVAEVRVACPHCGGTGQKRGGALSCLTCGGTGVR